MFERLNDTLQRVLMETSIAGKNDLSSLVRDLNIERNDSMSLLLTLRTRVVDKLVVYNLEMHLLMQLSKCIDDIECANVKGFTFFTEQLRRDCKNIDSQQCSWTFIRWQTKCRPSF